MDENILNLKLSELAKQIEADICEKGNEYIGFSRDDVQKKCIYRFYNNKYHPIFKKLNCYTKAYIPFDKKQIYIKFYSKNYRSFIIPFQFSAGKVNPNQSRNLTDFKLKKFKYKKDTITEINKDYTQVTDDMLFSEAMILAEKTKNEIQDKRIKRLKDLQEKYNCYLDCDTIKELYEAHFDLI